MGVLFNLLLLQTGVSELFVNSLHYPVHLSPCSPPSVPVPPPTFSFPMLLPCSSFHPLSLPPSHPSLPLHPLFLSLELPDHLCLTWGWSCKLQIYGENAHLHALCMMSMRTCMHAWDREGLGFDYCLYMEQSCYMCPCWLLTVCMVVYVHTYVRMCTVIAECNVWFSCHEWVMGCQTTTFLLTHNPELIHCNVCCLRGRCAVASGWVHGFFWSPGTRPLHLYIWSGLVFCFVAQPLGSCAVHFEVECGLVLGSWGRAGVLGRSLVRMLC